MKVSALFEGLQGQEENSALENLISLERQKLGPALILVDKPKEAAALLKTELEYEKKAAQLADRSKESIRQVRKTRILLATARMAAFFSDLM